MNYDNLIVGEFPVQKDTVTIGGDQALKAGCVLGRKTISAGAKGSYYFALSALTASAGVVTLTVDGTAFAVDTTTASTVDTIIADLVAAVNADTTCAFKAEADTTNHRIYLTAKAVGAFAGDIAITLTKSSALVLTIGSKTQATAAADASNGEFYAVNSSLSDGTEVPRAVLLEDVTVESGETGKALVAYTGAFNKSKLTFGSTDTWATHSNAMRDRSMFAVEVVEA